MLKKLFLRKKFEGKCDLWKTRDTLVSIMMEIYDGKIWQDVNGIKCGFLKIPRK